MSNVPNELMAFALMFIITLFVFKKAKSILWKIIVSAGLILVFVLYIVPMLRG